MSLTPPAPYAIIITPAPPLRHYYADIIINIIIFATLYAIIINILFSFITPFSFFTRHYAIFAMFRFVALIRHYHYYHFITIFIFFKAMFVTPRHIYASAMPLAPCHYAAD
jgi:hypothetical protein